MSPALTHWLIFAVKCALLYYIGLPLLFLGVTLGFVGLVVLAKVVTR